MQTCFLCVHIFIVFVRSFFFSLVSLISYALESIFLSFSRFLRDCIQHFSDIVLNRGKNIIFCLVRSTHLLQFQMWSEQTLLITHSLGTHTNIFLFFHVIKESEKKTLKMREKMSLSIFPRRSVPILGVKHSQTESTKIIDFLVTIFSLFFMFQ